MKKVEKLAIIAIILWLVTLIPNQLVSLMTVRLYGHPELLQMEWNLKGIVAIRSILSVIVKIGIAIWMFILTKRKGGSPWIWSLFCLIFGLIAPVLYFVGGEDIRGQSTNK